MIYIVVYKQLKHQLQRVLGKDIRCISMYYPLEEGDIRRSSESDKQNIAYEFQKINRSSSGVIRNVPTCSRDRSAIRFRKRWLVF